MRRCSTLLLLCALLGACRGTADLSPQEVLKRTARASQDLSSARFFLVATPRWEYGSAGGDLTFNTDGRLQNGGDQVQFVTSVQGDIRSSDGFSVSVTSAFEVITAGPEEIYLNVHTLESQPPYSLLQPKALMDVLGKWLKISSPIAPEPVSSVTPDPHLLRMQAEVVDIVSSRGREHLSGHSVYHYLVRLNTDKLVAFLREVSRVRQEPLDTALLETLLPFVNAEGELFIDTETFLIQRLVWHINAPNVPFGTFSLDLTLDLKDHGKAPPILPPLDAIPLPLTPSFPLGISPVSSGELFQEVTSPLQEELMEAAIPKE